MRRAFTVVELLVVIAIIGVLTALTLPAVQMAREASRRTTCANHLKQIVIAAQAHNEAFEYFPNAGGRDGQRRSMTTSGGPRRALEQDWGVFYQILPYLEQQAMYTNPNDAEVAGLKFKGYFCPTRRPPKAVNGSTANMLAATVMRGAVDYAGNGGSMGPAFPSPMSLSNQTGTIIPRPGAAMGITTEKITAESIADGLSNVLMFGERNFNRKPIGTQVDEDNGYFNGWSFDTIRWSHNGRPAPDRPVPNGPTNTTYDYRFGSSHSGVVLLAYCDGSVKVYRIANQYSTDPMFTEDQVFMQLSHRRDNKFPQLP
jgi:prepilin-type N-terminal cleavage/methylation domain-containing protein